MKFIKFKFTRIKLITGIALQQGIKTLQLQARHKIKRMDRICKEKVQMVKMRLRIKLSSLRKRVLMIILGQWTWICGRDITIASFASRKAFLTLKGFSFNSRLETCLSDSTSNFKFGDMKRVKINWTRLAAIGFSLTKAMEARSNFQECSWELEGKRDCLII